MVALEWDRLRTRYREHDISFSFFGKKYPGRSRPLAARRHQSPFFKSIKERLVSVARGDGQEAGGKAMTSYREETDLLGTLRLESDRLWGIHTQRALQNFHISGQRVHSEFIQSYAMVKLACLQTAHRLGSWQEEPEKYQAMERACQETMQGINETDFPIDALQGGAGTSTNMNLNEVLANRTLELLGAEKGRYDLVSPSADLNRFQSTNDTYPTALRLAAIQGLRRLEDALVDLQEGFQEAEKHFAHVVKVGRTQMQDAVLITLGREMGAYAEAMNRDRWRVYKCEERLRSINLGGTAIGTGLTAPREFIFRVTDVLSELSGIGLARSENLLDATQNLDVFVEVSGMLKACATSLFKIANDLRFLSSGPDSGIGEIRIPAVQAGSSIMPGKVNPVILESVMQTAMWVMGHDASISMAVSMGNLELNPFLPLITHQLLSSIFSLERACRMMRKRCVDGLEANLGKLDEHVKSSMSLLTALVPELGYESLSRLAPAIKQSGLTVYEYLLQNGIQSEAQLNTLLNPEHVCRLGHPLLRKQKQKQPTRKETP